MKNIIKKIAMLVLAVSLSGAAFFGGTAKTVKAESEKTKANLILGNARWVTSGASEQIGDRKIGKYLLSWDISVLDVVNPTANGKYVGYIWNADETERYEAVLAILSNETVVDTTSCKAALYVDTTSTTFKIKKSEAFALNRKSGNDQPDEIYFASDYLITCTLDSSVITTSDINAKGDSGETEGSDTTAPTIFYEGETTLEREAGDCVPLVFAKATDLVDGDVLVTKTWSANSHDENYKLLAGTHVLTLVAKDKAGNAATLAITVKVR